MMARKPTGSAKDCNDKHAPRIQIQFAQIQWPLSGFLFFFNGIRREFTGVNRIQLWIEGSYLEGNLFLYRGTEWCLHFGKIMITMFLFFSLFS